jgi:hypothetical protein
MQKLTSFTHSLAPHGGKGGKGFMGSVQEERHDKRTGARKGNGTVAHGEIPGRKGRKGLKWKTRLGMEKGY